MKRRKKRVEVRTVEMKVGRKCGVILLFKPSMRMPFPDEVIDELSKRYKAGVFCAFRVLPKRKKRGDTT